MTPELMKKQMTEAEWQKVYDMSKDKNLYHNLCSSLFPTIHGKLYESLIYASFDFDFLCLSFVYSLPQIWIKFKLDRLELCHTA